MRYVLIFLLLLITLTSCKEVINTAQTLPNSNTAHIVANIIEPSPSVIPINHLSPVAESIVTDAEVSSTKENHKYYDKHYQTATFAGSGSGATVCVGTDLGQNTAKFTTTCFTPYYNSNIVQRLANCSGNTTTSSAKRDVADLQDIIFPWSTAINEFDNYEVPIYYQLTLRTFPGLSKMSNNAISACCSVIYNRGSSMAGPSRVDMRALRTAVADGDYQGMSEAILHMNVTMRSAWQSEGIYDGMVARRKTEATLVLTPDS